MSNLELWYSRVDVEDLIAEFQPLRREGAQAGGQEPGQDTVEGQPEGLLETDGDRRRRAADHGRSARRDPDRGRPRRRALHEFEEFLHSVLRSYRRTLTGDRRRLLERYRYVHAARKVVGVGSVGTRAFIMLLLGRDDADPLFLQFKEAEASVLEPFLGKSEFSNHGQRVVEGQRLTQAASDIMLGWIRAEGLDGIKRDFYVRQLWDAKGSALVELMEPEADEHVRERLRRGARPRPCALRRRDRDRELPRHERYLRPRPRPVRRVVRRPKRARLQDADRGRRERTDHSRDRDLGARPPRQFAAPATRARSTFRHDETGKDTVMSKPFKGTINIDIKDSVPDWEPYAQPCPPEDAPNVLYVVLDDVGFSAMESFGGLIETPNIKRIADRGLLYTNFHTTALCSPTRSCLLTGRNHTTNSMACITEAASGFPNASGHIPGECAMIPAILGELGWNTYIVGQVAPLPRGRDEHRVDEEGLAARARLRALLRLPRRRDEPVVSRHHLRQPPGRPAQLPEDGYHFSVDITDKALSFIKDAKVVAPDKPFFLYYALGAAHAPHHVPKEWADKYKGKFDMGYEAYRELVFANQKKLGIIPDHAELSPINPYTDLKGPQGQGWGDARRRASVGLPQRRREARSSRGWRRSTPAS